MSVGGERARELLTILFDTIIITDYLLLVFSLVLHLFKKSPLYYTNGTRQIYMSFNMEERVLWLPHDQLLQSLSADSLRMC